MLIVQPLTNYVPERNNMLRFKKAEDLKCGDHVECTQNYLRKDPVYTKIVSEPRFDGDKIRVRIITVKGEEVNRAFPKGKTVAILC